VAGGDVEDAARAPGGLQAGQGQAQEFLEVQLALADAAPADGVEVVPVDGPPDGAAAGGVLR
jgi:hypothetical protein